MISSPLAMFLRKHEFRKATELLRISHLLAKARVLVPQLTLVMLGSQLWLSRTRVGSSAHPTAST